jgi:uncharacterized protein (TIGR02271 family)
MSGPGCPRAVGAKLVSDPSTGRDSRGADDAMTRSEEELRVGKARRPSELVRLKKRIVTEPKQVTVPVQHEEVHVEREPVTHKNIGEAMKGPELRERDHEVTLHEEQIEVEKKVVPMTGPRLVVQWSVPR